MTTISVSSGSDDPAPIRSRRGLLRVLGVTSVFVWAYPWTTGVALVISMAFLAGAVASDTRTSLYALGLLAASYPVYLLTTRMYLLTTRMMGGAK